MNLLKSSLIVCVSVGMVPAILNQAPATAQPRFIYARFESVNYPRRYIRHRNFQGYVEPISTNLDELDSSFRIRTGLADPNCISLESKNFPDYFLRHQNFRIVLSSNDGSTLFRKDATFCPKTGLSSKGGTSYESSNLPGYYIRHRDWELWLDKFNGSRLFRDDASFLRRPTP